MTKKETSAANLSLIGLSDGIMKASVVPEFLPTKNNFKLWLERLEIHFEELEYTEETQKRTTLLKSIGSEAYAVVRSLCDPKLPKDTKFEVLVQFLRGFYLPTVANLDAIVLDKFVCGLSEKFFKRLCEEDEKLTPGEALRKALIAETKLTVREASTKCEVNFG